MSYTEIMRPGVLVALKTGIHGGVHYERRDIERADDGTVAKWETTRLMDDPEEHKRAREIAGKAATAVTRLCIRTSFGLLCPSSREAELDLAIAAARMTVNLWNAEANHTTVAINAIKGRIADNDEEAVRALLSEASELVQRMDEGLAKADVTMIRDAASRARKLTEIMGDQASENVSAAIAAARDAAKEIVRRVGAEGKTADEVIATIDRDAFDKARFAFLDSVQTELDALPPIDVQRMAEIEAYCMLDMGVDVEGKVA